MRKSGDGGNGKSAAKATVSGPRKGPRDANGSPAARKMQGTQSLAAEFPFNANKPHEIGDATRKPRAGATAKPANPAVTASTLTEVNTSPKTGSEARRGTNPITAPLEHVRVDSGGQVLTTNFAQPAPCRGSVCTRSGWSMPRASRAS
jgi:catalase